MAFEFVLLRAVGERTRASVLAELGLDSKEADRLCEQCTFRIPQDLNSPISRYIELLGNPQASEAVATVPIELFGSIKHEFTLMFWPHLHWIVYERPGGGSWNVGFENYPNISSKNFAPAMVRPGLWTRIALERLSRSHQLHEGWDEWAVVRFNFDDEYYEGTFSLGLLQEWRLVT